MIREAVQAEDYVSFDYSGVRTENGVRGWGSTSVEPRKHHVYTGLTNSIGILLETPNNSRRVMRDGTVREIPEDERYYHQIRGGVHRYQHNTSGPLPSSEMPSGGVTTRSPNARHSIRRHRRRPRRAGLPIDEPRQRTRLGCLTRTRRSVTH